MINPEMNSGSGYRSSNEIESDIRRTRGRMDATLDELSERLTARSILNMALDLWDARAARAPRHEEAAEIHIHADVQDEKPSYAKTMAKRQAKKAFRGLSHQIQENPIPSLLIGAGIAWMLFDHDEDEREYVELSGRRYRVSPAEPSGPLGSTVATPATAYEYEEVEYEDVDHGPGVTDRAKEKLHQGKEAVAGAAESAKEKLSDLGDSASQAVHRAADRFRGGARSTYSRGRSGSRQVAHHMKSGYQTGAERFEDAVDEHPLAVGIGFAALGALMGLLLPHTRREDELLGERSDELLHTAKEKGMETFERGKAVVERVAEATLDEAQKQGLTPGAAGDKLSSLASKAGEIARRAKDEAATAAEEQGLTPEQLKEKLGASTATTSSEPFPTSTTMPSSGSFGSTSGSDLNMPSPGQSATMPAKGSSQQGDCGC
ncbi:MAG: DUF3618 domain-containing protein [Verrucomicrobiaceae bacterium]|nr:MAG: DUF3618 domain-containing protein [Verrucomicrobiaceae bacterium]